MLKNFSTKVIKFPAEISGIEFLSVGIYAQQPTKYLAWIWRGRTIDYLGSGLCGGLSAFAQIFVL